jgi:multidrug efflux system outer membrane protein
MAQLRFEGGLTSEVDWRQAQAEFHRTEAFVQEFERLARQKENELSVLLGRNPSEIARGTPVQNSVVPPDVPSGLPSDLLDRRPDLLAAEQRLVAANADIGQAKALLFPRISLTAAFGFQSVDLENVFDSGAKSYSLFGNLLQPIFNAGKNKRRVQVTESVMRQTLYEYEKTVLQAFQEVEDVLIAYQKTGEQRVSQGARVQAQRRVLELAEVRYRGGVADYLEVLDAQRSLFNAELDEVEAIRGQLVSLIRLYKALGGGWPVSPDPEAEARKGEPAAG